VLFKAFKSFSLSWNLRNFSRDEFGGSLLEMKERFFGLLVELEGASLGWKGCKVKHLSTLLWSFLDFYQELSSYGRKLGLFRVISMPPDVLKVFKGCWDALNYPQREKF
jgi:hypothetical protein